MWCAHRCGSFFAVCGLGALDVFWLHPGTAVEDRSEVSRTVSNSGPLVKMSPMPRKGLDWNQNLATAKLARKERHHGL